MTQSYFFCGIGGSGMMPLAMIVAGRGGKVAGSDRSLDQGRIADKFAALEALGIRLFPQDGSGPKSGDILIASAAIEETVPDVVAADRLGLQRLSRADLLAQLFNASRKRIAVGGTSGKSTVTGMIGWILDQAGRDPTIMNGAVMKNYATPDAPFASARVGKGDIFVSEVDESDGTIALYRPTVAVLNNVSVDHKSIEELRTLFGDFIARAKHAVVNIDDSESYYLLTGITHDQSANDIEEEITFGLGGDPHLTAIDGSVIESATGLKADIVDKRVVHSHPLQAWLARKRDIHSLSLQVPGRHNLMNALAAIGAANAVGVPVADAVAALSSFKGLARRFDIVGTANGITVIDDFGHNPDKIAATLDTLHAFPGRLLIFFQPHGYGPLRLMGAELAKTFRTKMQSEDRLLVCDPAYFGGTVDRSKGSDTLVAAIGTAALHIPERAACGDWLIKEARRGDRILIMGARDDTLSTFAASILQRLDG